MVPAREPKDGKVVKSWICSLIPWANAQEFGEQWRGNFCCCRHCVSCSVEKLNLFTSTEFTRRNRIFNILNIKYTKKTHKSKTFYYDFISLNRSVDALADLAFPESLELSQCPWKCHTWGGHSNGIQTDAMAQMSSPQISLLNVSCRCWPGVATPQWLFFHLFQEGRIQQFASLCV